MKYNVLSTAGFKLKSYLSFLLKSTNQHGVHSPFVYDLVTKCFYNTEKGRVYHSIFKEARRKTGIRYNTAKLLNRIPSYFNCKNVLVLSNTSDFIVGILSFDDVISVDNTIRYNQSYDLIYIEAKLLTGDLKLESLLSVMYNDSVIIMKSIHGPETNTLVWEKVKIHPKVTVTIDTF